MNDDFTDLEALWNSLLSGQAELIRSAYESLSEDERESVYVHLNRMVNEPGWQPEQRASAQAALRVLQSLVPPN